VADTSGQSITLRDVSFGDGNRTEPFFKLHLRRPGKESRSEAVEWLPLANTGRSGLSADQEAAVCAAVMGAKPSPPAGEQGLVVRMRLFGSRNHAIASITATDRRTGEIILWANGWGFLRPDARDKDLFELARLCAVPLDY